MGNVILHDIIDVDDDDVSDNSDDADDGTSVMWVTMMNNNSSSSGTNRKKWGSYASHAYKRGIHAVSLCNNKTTDIETLLIIIKIIAMDINSYDVEKGTPNGSQSEVFQCYKDAGGNE